MQDRFENKTAIVTGAASGIGRATAIRLANEGANLMLIDKEPVQLYQLVDDLKQTTSSDKIATCVLDIADEASIANMVERTIEQFSSIDILINNAGIACGRQAAYEQDLEQWHSVLSVNLLGVVATTKHVSQKMIAQSTEQTRGGTIVNTASVAGIRSGAGGNAYSASKAAVINFTKTAACDLGKYNIRVNAVCPGLIETGMTQRIFDMARNKGVEDKLGARCELLRPGAPEEVAAAICFLASDDSSYITGQALAVDGGNTASLNMPGMKV